MGEKDDLTLDFSKVKGFFKSKKKEVKESKKQGKKSEELVIEPETVKRFFKKYSILFLILIPIILSIYLRSMPAYLPITDQWAENAVQGSIKSNIEQQINQQYPNLPAENRQALVNQQFQQAVTQQKKEYEAQVKAVSQQFKSHLQDDDGQTYLLAIDPYTYYRTSRNMLENGHPGDIIKNGVPWDNHKVAPIGGKAKTILHNYVILFVYKIMNFFDSKVSLMKGSFYVPLLIATLSVIPAFFIARRFGGNIAGLFASVMVAIHPNFLTRTIAGFSDTDSYNVFFPLLIVWLFLEAFYVKDIKKRIMLSSFSGTLLGIYSFAWAGWWYIFDIMLGAIGIFILYQLYINRDKLKNILKKPEVKNALIIIACFIVFSGIFVSIFVGFGNFIKSPLQPIWFTAIKDPAKANLWPNVYTTVAELNPASLPKIITGIGGKFLFFIAILGIIFTLIRKQEGKVDIKYAVLLILWFIGTMYAATKGVRFILVLVPAFGVAFGIACGTIYQYVSKWISKNLSVDKKIIKPIMIIVLCLLLIAPFKSAKVTAINEVPSFDDGWYNTLTKIKDNSEENAIINSWWDFGHWFKAMADRAVTFDGGSQNNPQAHWIGNVLLTSNEDEAIGILRMMDCGADTAFDELNEEIDDTVETVD
ncbi:dolichyl-diphosphooligosaccharide--protein glycosyltransferase subunit STT3, partial [Candidatus Woesearchaeota archaeon]|nr:dolichyl-diphosphooligosaccharide--protein glycosyltransferase subunit STT3 [Candidatus Woesearchaeota archaeon]